tara:strand:- start:860 stop:988 length:129 start_codon:yes stop_codon:yes gene_type:complete
MLVREICNKENIKLENKAYMGEDLNCRELLNSAGFQIVLVMQ